jgi:hypothetical protein
MRYLLAALIVTALAFALGGTPYAATEPRMVAITATTPPEPGGDWRSKGKCKNARVTAHFTKDSVRFTMSAECLDDEGYRRETEIPIPCPNGNKATTRNGKLYCV